MKTSLTLLILLSSSLFCSNELSWVDEQVEAIKPSRTGMKNSELAKISDPFIFLKRNSKEEQNKQASAKSSVTKSSDLANAKPKRQTQVLTLSMVLNSSAMINQKWYQKGDKLNGYTVEEIHPNSVLLRKHKKQLMLSTKSVSKNLKFNNK